MLRIRAEQVTAFERVAREDLIDRLVDTVPPVLLRATRGRDLRGLVRIALARVDPEEIYHSSEHLECALHAVIGDLIEETRHG